MRALGFGVVVALGFSVACGSEAPTVGPTDGLIGRPGGALAEIGVQCSDQVTMRTENYSGPRVQVNWSSGPGVQTFEVEVSYSRDGLVPPRVLAVLKTNQPQLSYPNTEHGGRYYVRVRVVHTDCGDVEGPWSRTVTIYVDGGPDTVSTGQGEAPPPPPPDDEDDDDDGEDEPALFTICHAPLGATSTTLHLLFAAASVHIARNKFGSHRPGHWNDHWGPCED